MTAERNHIAPSKTKLATLTKAAGGLRLNYLLMLVLFFQGISGLNAQIVDPQVAIFVFDEATGEPLEAATLVVQDFHSKKELYYGVTDEDGRIAFAMEKPVLVNIRYLGYRTINDTILSAGSFTFLMHANSVYIDEVVITGQYAPTEIRNSVFKVDVIQKGEIEQRGAVSLRDLLVMELNLDVSQDDVFGSNLSMQGIDGANVKILVDGVPMIGRLNNQLDISQINLNNAERIELIKGPLSVVYGTNALAGVINIITAKDQQDKLGIHVSGQYESHGRYNADARVGYRLKNQFIQLSGGRYFFDGFADPDTLRNMQWNPKEQYFANALYTSGFKNINMRFQADYFHEKILNRYDPVNPFSVIAKDDYYRTRRQNYVFSMEDHWKESEHHFDFMTSFSVYRRAKNSFFKNLATLEENLASDPLDQDTTKIYQFNTRGSYSIEDQLKKVSFQIGLDINTEIFKGTRMLDSRQSISDYAVFTTLKYRPFNRLVFQPGFRIAHNTKYNAPLTPALNIKYDINDHIAVRASYAKGYRAPNLKELYLFFVDINHNIQGNDSLNAESAHNVQADISFFKRFKSHSLNISSRFYYNRITDRINLAFINQASNLYSYVNIHQSRSAGGELDITYHTDHIKLSTAVSLNRIENRFEEREDLSGANLYPQVKSELQYQVPKWKLTLNLVNKWSGRNIIYSVDEEDASIAETEISAFNFLDISAKKSLWDQRFNLALGIKNLLGVTQIETAGNGSGVHTGGPDYYAASPGRVFFIKANYYFYQ